MCQALKSNIVGPHLIYIKTVIVPQLRMIG